MSTDEDKVELMADGRHWLVVCCGVRCGGFKTKEAARDFRAAVIAQGITNFDETRIVRVLRRQ
jgi:hypothetical protein